LNVPNPEGDSPWDFFISHYLPLKNASPLKGDDQNEIRRTSMNRTLASIPPLHTRLGRERIANWIGSNIQFVLVPIALAIFFLAWEIVVVVNQYPVFILPTPRDVAAAWLENWSNGSLPRHVGITLAEIILGFGIAFAFASVVGYALAKSPLVEKIVSPYLVASQAVPLVAVGPLVIIWIKIGLVQNAMVAALVCFFPMLVNTIVGVRGAGQEQRELMRSYGANALQVLYKLELPAALPVIFGGVRVGTTLSVVGVIVVEMLWADRGLGFLLNFSRGVLDTPMLFATVATIAALALSLYLVVVLLERWAVQWKRSE
jgi:NitT/TauT family transport system permease protein